MPESVEDKCRKKLAALFNDSSRTGWLPNSNAGDGRYISGRPDAEVWVCGGTVVAIECKGDDASLFLGDPLQLTQSELERQGQKYKAAGWHTHQRLWYEKFSKPLGFPYFIAALIAGERSYSRFNYSKAGLFLVPPEAWLELEAAVFPRKTVALNPELERIHEHKAITLDSVWSQYRLEYSGDSYSIPQHHPIYNLIYRGETNVTSSME